MRGLRWKAVAELLPGRTESGCRNRWVATSNPDPTTTLILTLTLTPTPTPTPTPTLTLTLALTLPLTRWVRNQEREFAAAGLLVHGAAAVFAALDAARQQESQTAMQMAS